MSLILLGIAFVLTGVNNILNKALFEMGLGAYRDFYMLAYWACSTALGAVVWGFTRHEVRRRDVIVGVVMGTAGALGLITFLLALRGMTGVVAFPVRSCGSIALTAGVSYALWKEKVSPMQWLGIACAVAAIYLLV